LLKTAFGNYVMGRAQTSKWFLLIQTLGNFIWTFWAVRLSLHRSHRWKHGESSQNHQWRL